MDIDNTNISMRWKDIGHKDYGLKAIITLELKGRPTRATANK